MPHRQANMAPWLVLDGTAEGRAAASIRDALGNAYAKYFPAWGVCKHRSGKFSFCAGIYVFFQVSGHYQTVEWAKKRAGELTFFTVHYSSLCQDWRLQTAWVQSCPCESQWKISLLAWRQLEPIILCKRVHLSLYRNSSNNYSWAEKNARNKTLPLTDAPDKENYLSSSASSFIQWFS